MSLFLKCVWSVWLQWLQTFLAFLFPARHYLKFGRRKVKADANISHRCQPKPVWVIQEVMRLKAIMPKIGCRKIADIFNRRFAESRKMTVSKTFVNEAIRKHKYEIQVLRKKIKNRKPRDIPHNLIWGLDLTGKTDAQGNLSHILGIVEHKSRMSLSLTAIKDKASVTILQKLLDAIEHNGKPKFLRTDNESVFNSRLFRFCLWLLGIRHQRIDKTCPWQNGRIERFFGTLKEKLDQWQVDNSEQLAGALCQFRFWYNHVRPHQYLDGKTPTEVWREVNVFKKGYKQEYWFEAWDGLLTGFFLKL